MKAWNFIFFLIQNLSTLLPMAQIQIPLKVASYLARVIGLDRFPGIVLRNDDNNNYDRGFAEIVDNQADLSNVQSQSHNKRRKVELSPWIDPKNVNRVTEALSNDKIATIGVCGMAGVGKTTLATQIYTRLKNRDIRFAVGWVSVGKDLSVYQLQQKIAGAFEFDLYGDEDETRRAAVLYGFLSRKNKCVLFIDDLWGDFRREDVGIPKKCKVVVITQLMEVCCRLHCQRVIKVEPLSEGESWQLFHHSIGGYVISDSKQVSRIRKLLFDKFAGLPLAITTVANSLRRIVDGNALRWREVLENMDMFIAAPTHLEDTINRLRLSYERLNDVKLQRCFLYAALYPKGYAINKEELIRLWIGLKLIDDVSSLQAQYDMGHSILNKLLNSCLLEACEDERRIKIHDLVRQMALSTAGDSFKVEAGIATNLVLQQNLQAVSLVNSSISMIPSGAPLMCRCLSTLLLQHNPLEFIPESFFSNMRALRVLNLSDTRISRLPKSIGELEELRVLDVSFCENLKQVPSLAKLLKLQFLDLSQTAIGQIPRSLDMLKKIIELNLSSIPEPYKIPSGLLPALSRLKKLTCHVGVGTIHELQKVDSLEILDARFINLCDLSSYVMSQHWCRLESYHIQVGCEVGSDRSFNRRISLQGCSLTGQEVDHIVVPSNIQELYFDSCRDFSSVSDVMYPVSYYPKNCEIQQAEAFPSLEICIISRCHDIEALFSPSWIENLQSLELLQVEDCQGLKGMIDQEAVECVNSERDYATISLPQLRRLIFTRLPQMTSFYKGRLVCSSLLSCIIMDCPELKRLPFSSINGKQGSFPHRLESIEGQEKWWDLLKWDQPESEALLKPLFRVKSLDAK